MKMFFLQYGLWEVNDKKFFLRYVLWEEKDKKIIFYDMDYGLKYAAKLLHTIWFRLSTYSITYNSDFWSLKSFLNKNWLLFLVIQNSAHFFHSISVKRFLPSLGGDRTQVNWSWSLHATTTPRQPSYILSLKLWKSFVPKKVSRILDD